MIITLTHDQMLDLWRLAAGLCPAAVDASIERFDSLDINRRLCLAMRHWYLELLDNAPLRLLRQTDITDRLNFKHTGDLYSARIPVDTRRVTQVTLGGIPAEILPSPVPMLTDTRLPLNRDTFSPSTDDCRPGATDATDITLSPRAAVTPTAVYVPPTASDIAVYAVLDPGEETYVLDESLLSQIPVNNPLPTL